LTKEDKNNKKRGKVIVCFVTVKTDFVPTDAKINIFSVIENIED
jgi:hypothetical protein